VGSSITASSIINQSLYCSTISSSTISATSTFLNNAIISTITISTINIPVNPLSITTPVINVSSFDTATQPIVSTIVVNINGKDYYLPLYEKP